MSRKRPAHRDQQKKRKELSSSSHLPDQTEPGEPREGLVITRFGSKLDVEDENGEIFRCTSRRKHGAIVSGDRVIWQPTHDNSGVIVELLERKTFLARPDDIGREKAIAANIDQLIIVSTVKALPEELYYFHDNLIDRYFIAAESLDITPVLVMNKVDLLTEEERAQLESDIDNYRKIGYQVRYTSTKKEQGLKSLVEQLAHHTSIFVGESGVGKSSIIRALLPEMEIRVGEVSASSGKGKHTTTAATLYHLPTGGNLIDSPGVREFGLHKIDAESLAYSFIEFRSYRGHCKFNNCIHVKEPQCAIKAALEDNEIDEKRYKNYLQILESLSAYAE